MCGDKMCVLNGKWKVEGCKVIMTKVVTFQEEEDYHVQENTFCFELLTLIVLMWRIG